MDRRLHNGLAIVRQGILRHASLPGDLLRQEVEGIAHEESIV
jgi:hypothetical protein